MMAHPADFAMKHGIATAAAIPVTVAVHSYLETLSAPGTALVFILFLALFNGLAAVLWRGPAKSNGKP
jgi:hypothetical protein